jgi:Mn-dependent DtxR family transcriptional regulator
MTEEVKEPDLDGSDNSVMSENSDVETKSQANWTDNFSEAELKVVTDKGFKSPQDLLKSYQEMEKLSSNKFSIPKAEDAEAWKKLDAKLGCPETIDGYELKDVAEIDKPYLDDFKSAALQAGMRPSQVDAMYGWYKERQDKLTEAFNAQVEKDKEEVRAEWGDDYSKNEELMKRGIRSTRLSEELLSNIEMSISTKEFMRLGKRLGEAVSEDTVKGLGGGASVSQEMSTKDWLQEILNNSNEGN